MKESIYSILPHFGISSLNYAKFRNGMMGNTCLPKVTYVYCRQKYILPLVNLS